MNLTSLDFAILGLLTQSSQSGYQIRQTFETTALGNYSSSPGSIYPALKKLQKLGLAGKTAPKGSKSQFQITKAGTKAVTAWLETPVANEDIPKGLSGLVLRFAFMGDDISITTKLTFLKSFQDGCQNYLDSLLEFHKAQSQNMPINGLLAFELGITSYQTQIQWATDAISKLKTHQNET
jgi:DNA-binding PadR family transcriptional regulator